MATSELIRDGLRALVGPERVLSTFHLFDFRSGGRWSLVMQGPDGKHYPNTVSFEVVEPRKVVLRHSAPDYGLTITGHTELTWEQRFDHPKTAGASRTSPGGE